MALVTPNITLKNSNEKNKYAPYLSWPLKNLPRPGVNIESKNATNAFLGLKDWFNISLSVVVSIKITGN